MIELQNLSKVFRTGTIRTTAVNSVRLSVGEGDFVAIMGPSGSGKSTLLNLLGLLDSPSSGDYRFRGHDVARLPERQLAKLRKQNISFIFQSFNLIDELTVADNVELPLAYQRIPRRERRRRVDEVLERLGLDGRAGHRPQELSGGQQQRVAVARALVTRPALILADEPTGNLDSDNGRQIMGLLQELHGDGTTIVMVTHSQRQARYARRIVHFCDGSIVDDQVLGDV